MRRGIDQNSPSNSNFSDVHMRGRQRTNSSQLFLVTSGLALNPASSVHVADRPVPTSTRPPERMSSTAVRSAILIGWLNSGTHTTMPNPTRIRLVTIAHAVRNSSGAGQCEYSSRKWCSTAHTWSKPSSSASFTCSGRCYTVRSDSRVHGRGTESS